MVKNIIILLIPFVTTLSLWGQRTSRMDFSRANVNEYAANFQYAPSNFNPNWECLGPFDTPRGTSASKGVGMINRIEFDPRYHKGAPGSPGYGTIYAASHFGGLWRSENEGKNWEVVNTDVQLPFTNIADMAIAHENPEVLFVCLGDGDHSYRISFDPYRGSVINPSFTGGVYRSTDYGRTWHPINGKENFLVNKYFLEKGGSIQNIAVNPNNANQVIFVSTKGIFKTENAMASPDEVRWRKVFQAPSGDATNWRGLEYKPGSPGTIYASGEDIYVSKNGGKNWALMTGPGTGLDFEELFKTTYNDGFCDGNKDNCPEKYNSLCGMNNEKELFPRKFYPKVINLAVTPAAPDQLYAYIFGEESYRSEKGGCNNYGKVEQRLRIFIYVYAPEESPKGTRYRWFPIYESKEWGISQTRMAIAASTENPNTVYYGAVNLKGTQTTTTFNELRKGRAFGTRASSGTSGYHVDVHALAFEPNTENPRLFVGNDGGVTVKKPENASTGGCKFMNNGLAVTTIWTFDDNEWMDEDMMAATGNQDCGVNILYKNPNNNQLEWKILNGGDGYGAQIDDHSGHLFYKANNTLYRYDPSTGKKNLEANNSISGHKSRTDYRPKDSRENFKSWLPNTFKIINHPVSGDMFWGFSELYRRRRLEARRLDASKPESLWELISDHGKKEKEQWKRRIYEFDISEADPNYIYIVNWGLPQFDLPPTIFRSVKGGCNGLGNYTSGYQEFEKNGPNMSCFEEIKITDFPKGAPLEIDYPIISNLTIHPENPNKIYVTFLGFNPKAKVWSWEYDPVKKKGVWKDEYSQSLNNLPVNAILCQKGTNERLYIGTDAGVYTKDASSKKWVKYGDFPNVRVTEMKINYIEGKLKVATFGRGMWQGDLLPYNNLGTNNALVIDRPTVWETPRALKQDVHIVSGGELTIKNEINMPKNSEIRVEPGGTLRLAGGHLINAGGKEWKGINKLRCKTQDCINKNEKALVLIDEASKINNVKETKPAPNRRTRQVTPARKY